MLEHHPPCPRVPFQAPLPEKENREEAGLGKGKEVGALAPSHSSSPFPPPLSLQTFVCHNQAETSERDWSGEGHRLDEDSGGGKT